MKKGTRNVRAARFTSRVARAIQGGRKQRTGRPLDVFKLAQASSYSRVVSI